MPRGRYVGSLLLRKFRIIDRVVSVSTMSKFVACVALLPCLSLGAAPATGKGYHQSGIIGQVQSSILFHNWNVRAVAEDGEVVADFLTDAEGNFIVDLKPGTYVLVAYINNVGPYPVVYGTPVTVTVQKKSFVPAVLHITLPPL